jgi:hypothetical protein
MTLGLLVVIGLVAGACGLGAPAATPTPPATNTPLPTDTPEPTATPTATPDLAATQTAAAEATRQAMEAQVKQEMTDLEIDSGNGHLAWVQTDEMALKNTGYWEPTYGAMAEDVEASNFVIKSKITWEATSLVYCGLVLRGDTPDPEKIVSSKHYEFYYLRFSGAPAWTIAFYKKGGEFSHAITRGKWAFSDAINMGNGEANEFILVAKGNEFTMYINGVRQGRYFDDSKSAATGYFGTFVVQDTGTSSCTYEDSWIWVYDE